MALTKIQAGSFEAGAIATEDLSANTTAAFAVSLAPKIVSVNVANSSYVELDDTAVSTDGGYVIITGSDFQSGAVVLIDTTQATSTTFVNSTTLRAQIPAKSAATYNIYVVNPDGGVGIKLNGVNYSATPTWVTTSPLANVISNTAFSGTFDATGATEYTVDAGSSLPDGMTLVGANGYYYGTITVANATTYSFTINATDAENQDSPATFNLTAVEVILDNYFNSTVLLLKGDGINGSNNRIFIDSSNNQYTITNTGNTTIGSFSPLSPIGWSAYFDGTGDYLTVADNAALDVDSGDFTMEAWVFMNVNNGSAVNTIFAKGFGSASGWMFWVQDGVRLRMYDSGGTQYNLVGNTTPEANKWHHVAVVRSGNTITLYLNGVSDGTLSYSGTNTNSAVLEIGGYNTGTAVYAGYISSARIIKGTALYTDTFTPPTSKLTAISGTSLLTLQDYHFVDKSTNEFSITQAGDPKILSFSPFAPSAAYNPEIHGGSAYFDGSGDYLQIPDSENLRLLSGNYSIEAWIYSSDVTPLKAIASKREASTGWMFYVESGYLKWNLISGEIFQSTSKLKNNSWYHVAAVKNGTTVTLYINGVADSTTTSSTTPSSTTVAVTLGRDTTSSSRDWNGYISDFRMITGDAYYTSNFNVPTEPLTNVNNTEILCNFNNAAIYDATGKIPIITNGTSQISTSVKKYGTGSIYSPTTTSYIRTPITEFFKFGLSDFTIEFWMYATDLSSQRNILDFRDSANGYVPTIYYSPSATLNFYVNASDRITGSSLSENTWYHIAVARSGTNTKMFINGTQTGSTWTDTSNYISTSLWAGRKFDATSPFLGYIDDLRITKGFARYTSNFTPATETFPVQ
jgi:hypothetical protein